MVLTLASGRFWKAQGTLSLLCLKSPVQGDLAGAEQVAWAVPPSSFLGGCPALRAQSSGICRNRLTFLTQKRFIELSTAKKVSESRVCAFPLGQRDLFLL